MAVSGLACLRRERGLYTLFLKEFRSLAVTLLACSVSLPRSIISFTSMFGSLLYVKSLLDPEYCPLG